jgi:mannitol-1-phosphate/altronate dehydrogenase
LTEALRRRTRPEPLIVFCAENHRSAAALLREAVLGAVEPTDHDRVASRVRFIDTVIGKMSGVITDAAEIRTLGLATITSALPSAFLVEEFDRILVSRVDPEGGALHPGMPVLREVDDLAPFEDAKLLGHNATHALGAFLGQLLDLTLFADLREVPGAMDFLRAAFIEESGRALIARHGGADPRFTPAGYADFADDLLMRMVNPHLADTIERAARDPRRKLGWDDRLVGLIRLGLAEGVPTPRYAMGVAAGLDVLRRAGEVGSDALLLGGIWPDDIDRDEAAAVLATVAEGRQWLLRWQAEGFAGSKADG